MKVCSFAETSAALQQAGYEVYRADLPAKVSGVAAVLDIWGTEPEEQQELLRRNPRAGVVLSASVIATVLVVVASILFHVCSRFIGRKTAA
jgi:hypothetical protein